MKVLFLIPYRQAPLGPTYLSSALKKEGHKTYSCLLDYDEARAAFKKFKPDILALNAIIGHINLHIEISRKLKKEFNFISVFGGPNATFCPEIIEEDGVDAVCRGEGELAFVEFVNALEHKRDITQIRNFWIKKEGEIHKAPFRPLISDLDTLPFPDRDLVFRVNPDYLRYRPFPVMASRGCLSNCAHCFNHAYRRIYGDLAKKIRWRSPENLINEIVEAKRRFPIKGIIILDDNIIFNMNWLRRFSEIYPQKVGIPFWCLVTPTFVNEEAIRCLSKAGCVAITLGLETGDQLVREQILRRKMSDDFLVYVCHLIKKYKIRLFSHNILGIPESPIENDFKTLNFNLKCKVDYADVNIYTPLPETDLGIYTKTHDMSCVDISNINFSPFKKVSTKIPMKKEVENLCDLFMFSVKFPSLIPVVKILIKCPARLLKKPFGKFNEFCMTYIRPHTYRKYSGEQFIVSLLSIIRDTYAGMFRRFDRLQKFILRSISK